MTSALIDSYAAAQAICRHHARSFYFASHFLPRRKRMHAYAVYAFCRLLDDAVDEAPSQEQAAGLAKFESLLHAVYAGRLPNGHLALPAFADTVAACDIPLTYFADLVEGCRMDLSPTRYQTWAGLERYCYHVAGVVGLLMTRVFSLQDRSAEPHAVAMGNAMQLTNVLRDVGEDHQKGRIYLPMEDLARFNVSEAQIAAGVVDENWRRLMRFEIARARRLYEQASLGLAKLDADGSRLTAGVMAASYSGILNAIEAQDYDVFSSRARLNTWQKVQRLPYALHLCRD